MELAQPGSTFATTVRRSPYYSGFIASMVLHVVLSVAAITALEGQRAQLLTPQVVYTVTIEGGERLGGIGQVPTEDTSKMKSLPNAQDPTGEFEEVKALTKEKKLETPSVVEDPQKAIEEKRKQELAEKKAEQKKMEEKKLQEKKKLEEQKKIEEKKKLDEKKKQEELDQTKKAADDKKKREEEKLARDKALQKAIKGAAAKYKGESTDVGGEGFGAAALGGKGMGGGTLASIEFIAYRNRLEQHIKQGWRWLSSTQPMKAQVDVAILKDGTISRVAISGSSGNSTFDDSVVRAVWKSSPVPQAPEDLYDKFAMVRITFDSAK